MRRRSLLALVALAVTLVACGSTSPASARTLDIRGTWAVMTVANGVQYPQTIHITTEDPSTGKFSGDDVGSGLTFTVTGTMSGSKATFVTTEVGGAYTAHDTATITPAANGSRMTMKGTFHDSNNTSGTFTGTRT